jgi:uncharacterized lipoprotein
MKSILVAALAALALSACTSFTPKEEPFPNCRGCYDEAGTLPHLNKK